MGGVRGPDDGQTGSVIRLLISALLEEEWQRHLQEINPCVISQSSGSISHYHLPLMSLRQCFWPHLSCVLINRNQPRRERTMSEFEKLRNRTVLTCPLVRPGFWSLWTLGGSPPGFSVPSLSPTLGRSMAQQEVGFLIEFFWWAGGGVGVVV